MQPGQVDATKHTSATAKSEDWNIFRVITVEGCQFATASRRERVLLRCVESSTKQMTVRQLSRGAPLAASGGSNSLRTRTPTYDWVPDAFNVEVDRA
jgi:hypothetical protein